jgi:hypothetical protein
VILNALHNGSRHHQVGNLLSRHFCYDSRERKGAFIRTIHLSSSTLHLKATSHRHCVEGRARRRYFYLSTHLLHRRAALSEISTRFRSTQKPKFIFTIVVLPLRQLLPYPSFPSPSRGSRSGRSRQLLVSGGSSRKYSGRTVRDTREEKGGRRDSEGEPVVNFP